jgi:hypothetical protein
LNKRKEQFNQAQQLLHGNAIALVPDFQSALPLVGTRQSANVIQFYSIFMASISNFNLSSIYELLTGLAYQDNFWSLFETAFGTQYDAIAAERFRSQWQEGDFGQSAKVEMVSQSILGTANGAFAASTNTIYLSDRFVATADRESLEAVLLDEYGHFEDAQVNSSDSTGDEGAIFAALVSDQILYPFRGRDAYRANPPLIA